MACIHDCALCKTYIDRYNLICSVVYRIHRYLRNVSENRLKNNVQSNPVQSKIYSHYILFNRISLQRISVPNCLRKVSKFTDCSERILAVFELAGLRARLNGVILECYRIGRSGRCGGVVGC